MKNKKVVSLILALAMLVSVMAISVITVNAADADTLKVWKVADFVGDDSDRASKNADGSITSKENVNNHLFYGLTLGDQGPLEAGTYYVKFTFMVTGLDGVTNKEDENNFGFWDVFAGTDRRFGSGGNGSTYDPDGNLVEAIGDIEEDVWYSVVDEIEAVAQIPADQEIRFKNLWNGGTFFLSFGAQVVVSKNDDPLKAAATADIGGAVDPDKTEDPNKTESPATATKTPSDSDSPKTGDASALIALFTVAGSAACGGLVLRSKKRK